MVEIELVCGLIGGEVEILKPVVIEIGCCDTGAVVEINVIEYVQLGCGGDGVLKLDSRFNWSFCDEEGVLYYFFFSTRGEQQE